jgi:hypothetical protein
MANREQYTAEQMINALKATRGMITYTSDYLGCDYKTVRRYIDKYATVKEAYEDAKDRIADNVENTLYDVAVGRRAKDGTYEIEPNVTALIFLAKTHPALRGRGYAERTEHTGADGGAMEFNLVYPDDK